MASVGHSLVGLSFADFSDKESRGGKLPYIWLGFMVLMSHLVDVVEWIVIVVSPSYFDRHFVTYSPMVTAGIAVVVCLLLFLVFRVRRVFVYVLTVLAIFSHLLLDLQIVRDALGHMYFGNALEDGEIVGVTASVPAEIWAYGGVLLLVMLFNASRQKGVPRGGRTLSIVFAVLLVGTAATRSPYAWGPAYAIAAIHALLLYRRCWTWRIVWGVLPLTPLLVMLMCELWSAHLYGEARDLKRRGQYVAAESAYREMIAVPTRSSKELARVYLGICLINQKRFGEAENMLNQAIETMENPELPRYHLAAMYMSEDAKGTDYYRPHEAAALCQALIADPDTGKPLRAAAERRLKSLRASGEIGT